MSLNWDLLLSSKRFGSASSVPEDKNMARSQFQRDYDRIIFSSPFRRLQNKTQVFPLPGSVFVHNRLTHSLEVASVGRSLGNQLALELEKRALAEDLFSVLGAIVSAACLAHDMGNPPFGHSGEKAISRYFAEGQGRDIRNMVEPNEWTDLTHFEGNANAFRVLTHQFNGRRKGGFALTYATLSSLVKYPYGSEAADTKKYKYGYFSSEKDIFAEIAEEQGIIITSGDPLRYCRHPLVYLVEAADDITYQVMDVEDAHKLKILSTSETKDILTAFWDDSSDKGRAFLSRSNDIFGTVTDVNEQISYLRAMLISKLVDECVGSFLDNYDSIMNGTFTSSLVDSLSGSSAVAMKQCSALAVRRIYNHQSVIEVELAGYRILGALLEDFVGAVLDPESHYAKKMLALLPEQFRSKPDATVYSRIQSVLDYISGMTDLYALGLYRNINGMQVSYQ